ncbi:putative RING finger membrane protein [Tolypocladium ophioglossoides CBS 100239]|uniref:RING-type E3 ubiquitin transferase n=1 Tax=Tolypocladium ophioglossoides (strain CBS 100239) TaxID=1163406 RepID=A0A0L0NBN8_TOLOC|nr:putative RING finger membrane protein [Tolypocladium ophioglossoides CBS 100239]
MTVSPMTEHDLGECRSPRFEMACMSPVLEPLCTVPVSSHVALSPAAATVWAVSPDGRLSPLCRRLLGHAHHDVVAEQSSPGSLLTCRQTSIQQPNMGWLAHGSLHACQEYHQLDGYEERISHNLTTLTTNSIEKLDGKFGGLLFVPSVTTVPSCDTQQYDFIPRNVTRRQQLPAANFNVIAIAPWFSIECTLAYLRSAGHGPIRGFIFYKPNNSTNKPQDVDSPVWNLDDGGAWKRNNHFPVFAVPGIEGQRLMTQLSLYAGTVSQVPHGDEISQLYGPNPNDYVRIWTDLTMRNPTNVPAVWSFVLIVIGALLLIISAVSLTMHFVQRRNRMTLQRRVQSGEVDLEAMGIKRLTVPASHVKAFPIFTYNAEPDLVNAPPTPSSPGGDQPPHAKKSSRKGRRSEQRSASSDTKSPGTARSVRSIRSKRRSITGTGSSTATNYQPKCHICLASFEHKLSIIRELPCGHIFHPACIDEFLTRNSSLCPMCKHCMLPRGYSPRITNGMVRRERAVRRLRERVDWEDSSFEYGDTKLKEWRKRLFSSSGNATTTTTSDVAMTPLPPSRATSDTDSTLTEGTNTLKAASKSTADSAGQDASRATASVKTRRFRRPRPRALRLLPTHQEEDEPKDEAPVGRSSPSSFARERMREIAAENAPFDDPDHQRPKWRRALSKAFPGFR